eukprot:CAMPEP_0194315584 /NCGR_PEP_ID=MMETSP0171-20130528/12397_1 /TAXON_ID=218684 /ORGANISM="Corethron pennatum, Strain L29A3" /LENGTH=160 /DNA_ID=CAMNT_0039071461 /DNA_START=95 /DNA_END=574 /DNA_ORIENTATION=+
MIAPQLLARRVSAAARCRSWVAPARHICHVEPRPDEGGRVPAAAERARGSPVCPSPTTRTFCRSYGASTLPWLVCHRKYSTGSAAAPAGSPDPPSSSKTQQIELSGRISRAESSAQLLRLFLAHEDRVNALHLANLWNKLGRQRDAADPRHRPALRRLVR